MSGFIFSGYNSEGFQATLGVETFSVLPRLDNDYTMSGRKRSEDLEICAYAQK